MLPARSAYVRLEFTRARLRRDTRTVAERHRDELALHRERRAVEEVPVRRRRIDVERVDLVEVRRVVGRRPAQVAVEAADDAERTADAEVAVEVEHTRDRDVGLVVARG